MVNHLSIYHIGIFYGTCGTKRGFRQLIAKKWYHFRYRFCFQVPFKMVPHFFILWFCIMSKNYNTFLQFVKQEKKVNFLIFLPFFVIFLTFFTKKYQFYILKFHNLYSFFYQKRINLIFFYILYSLRQLLQKFNYILDYIIVFLYSLLFVLI